MNSWSDGRQTTSLTLDAFVPPLLRRRLADRPDSVLQPSSERFEAALLLTDLSGFSSLAESFGGRGPRGAEELTHVLNFFCGHLVDVVGSHGGELIKFAGDAAVALWPCDEGRLADAAALAAECAVTIQRRLTETIAPHGARLPLRAALGVGTVLSATVGGADGRWDFVIAGEALSGAVRAAAVAGPADIAVSLAAWRLLARTAQGSPLAPDVMRLDAVTASGRTRPRVVEPPPAAEALLRAFVPRSVQARLSAGSMGWLAEFRRASALFIRLDTVDYASPSALEPLQQAVVAVQTAVHRYGGSLNQVVVDDKGTVIVCGWGLALHAYADDQVRAVRAALDLRAEFNAVGRGGSFGLATGDVFAGLIGTSRRCEFTMIGDAVNIAARLMETSGGDVLCDAATYDATRSRIDYDILPALRIKGRDGAVDVFRPREVSSDRGEIVGRVAERRALRDRLETLAHGGAGGLVILDGEPGIGKSRLVADIVEHAVANGVRTMMANGDPIERATPYHVWSALLDKLLWSHGQADAVSSQNRVLTLLESNPRLLPFVSLLNPLLGLSFAESEASASATPRGRAALTRELLVHLFRGTASGRPTLLILEDAHWLDSESWAIAETMSRELPHLLLLIAMRVGGRDAPPEELPRLTAAPGTLALRLEALSAEEARGLACRLIRARVLSEPVARLLHEKAGGHPFFIEELVYALRDRGVIAVEQGVCRLAPSATAIDAVQLPNTVQVAVAGRIDQLTVDVQLTLKVASVFGGAFSRAGLLSTYPVEIRPAQLDRHLDALVEYRLLDASGSDRATWRFKHAIIEDVTYGLLPYALRREQHHAVATWYETQYGQDLAPYYPLLAHHWAKADQADRAILYLERAGEQARQRHANEEVLRILSEAVAIDEHRDAQPGPFIDIGGRRRITTRDAARIAWACRLGDASTNLSRWDQGRRYFKSALTLLGSPQPASDREFFAGILRGLAVQCLRRLAPHLSHRARPEAEHLLLDAVIAHQRIGSIYYQESRVIAVIYNLVAALNLAERLGRGPQFALACADIANILGLVPLRPAARIYQRMAFQIADTLDDRMTAARIRGRAAIYRLGVGDWESCRDLENAMALCETIGDSYVWEENATIRARAAQLRGEFTLAAQLGAEVRARSAISRSLPHEIWGMAAEMWAHLSLGRAQFVVDQLPAAMRLLSTATSADHLARLDFHGAAALAHLGRGELEEAYQQADGLMDALTANHRPGYFAVLGLSAGVETYLTVWEARGDSARGVEASRQAARALRYLERYARLSPPARPRLLLWRGWFEWLGGKRRRAHHSWQECLRESERFGLPYELARAYYEIGRRLPPAEGRRAHLVRAEAEFRRMRADTELTRVATALAAAAS